MRHSSWSDARSTGRRAADSQTPQGAHVLVHDEVRGALADGRPVVALESTIISHGLPRPDNARLAREFEQAVRDGGAVPATIAEIDGDAHNGLDDAGLDRLPHILCPGEGSDPR